MPVTPLKDIPETDPDSDSEDEDESDDDVDCDKDHGKKNKTFSGINDMVIAAIDKVGKDPIILFLLFIIVNLQATVDLVIGRFSNTTIGTQLTNKGIVLQGVLMVVIYTAYKLLEGYIF